MKTHNLRIEDLYWVAGFLEGEGSFTKCGGTIKVEATQVQREPVDRLVKILGGKICVFSRKEVTGHVYHKWNVYGEFAENLMKTLFVIMSPRRQDQIKKALDWYVTRPGRNYQKSGRKLCRKGLHVWEDQNIYFGKNGRKICKACCRISQNRSQQRIRARVKEALA